MEKEFNYIIYALLLIIWGTACKKIVDAPVPKDRVFSERVFTDSAKATSAITGIYGNMINGAPSFANSYVTVYAGISSDELLKYNPPLVDQEFMSNSISPGNTAVLALWRGAYQTIYHSNAALEGLNESTGISTSLKNQLMGEALFIRAFTYSYLVQLFGDVPLVLGTNFNENALLPRTSATAIFNQVISDLQQAKQWLRPVYPVPEKIRANKWAAAALLSRLYLYTKEWEKAETEATEIIGSGLYLPLPPLNSVFLKNSREAILQLVPTTGLLKETNFFRPLGNPLAPQSYLAPALVTSFEPGDQRRKIWIDSVTHQNVRFYYPAKYRNTTTTVTEYYTLLRLAEVFLVRAEARLEQGKTVEAVADINTLRQRASLPSLLNSIGPVAIRVAIEQQRQSELFCEWGHRWFDLKRWEKTGAILKPIKPAWKETAQWFPIPVDEILINPSLTQNIGY